MTKGGHENGCDCASCVDYANTTTLGDICSDFTKKRHLSESVAESANATGVSCPKCDSLSSALATAQADAAKKEDLGEQEAAI